MVSSKFPKVMTLKQLDKKEKLTVECPNIVEKKDMKSLKMLVGKKDFILGDNATLVNLASVVDPQTKDIDKNRLIKLVRLACETSPNVAFYGWNPLMLRLNIQYGTKQCLTKAMEIKNFIIKHGKAYMEYQGNKSEFNWIKAPKELLEKRYDRIFCKTPDSETSKLKAMWVKVDDVYCIYDDFYEALTNYGYTKEQLRGVIHRCEMSGNSRLIPYYLRKKYLVIPNGDEALQKVLYND